MSSRERKTSAARKSRRAAPRTAQTGPMQGFAVGEDGTPIYYRLAGPVEGAAAVVFADGIGCDGYVWKYLEPALAAERPIIHLHYRGHGKTPAPRDASRVTVADCADDVARVLDAAGDLVSRRGADEPPFAKVFLAGHSMGVQVCLETFRRHPDRVAGLILVCGSYGTPLRTFKNSRVLEDLLPVVRLA